MKNPSPFVRRTLITLLDGVITYNGSPVPCLEGSADVLPYFIEVSTTTATRAGNRDNKAWKVDQVIEVISEQTYNMRKHVDAIGEEVMQLMEGMTGDSTWQIGTIKEPSINYLDEQNGDSTYINRLLLRYNFLITLKTT